MTAALRIMTNLASLLCLGRAAIVTGLWQEHSKH